LKITAGFEVKGAIHLCLLTAWIIGLIGWFVPAEKFDSWVLPPLNVALRLVKLACFGFQAPAGLLYLIRLQFPFQFYLACFG
jgi:hypothetical protein